MVYQRFTNAKPLNKAIEKENSEYIVVENPADLNFRPIVGGPNSVTQRLSHFLYHFKTTV